MQERGSKLRLRSIGVFKGEKYKAALYHQREDCKVTLQTHCGSNVIIFHDVSNGVISVLDKNPYKKDLVCF